MAERSRQRQIPKSNYFLIFGTALSFLCLAAALAILAHPQPNTATTPAAQSRKLYRIEVDDADEAGLIQQELKLKPEVVRGRNFYYYGDDNINRRLAAYGYAPVITNPEEIFTRVVRIAAPKDEAVLRKAGTTILLRERESWILRGTATQLRELASSGYVIQELGKREPVPRRIQIVLSKPGDINKQIGGRVEITEVRKDRSRGVVVIGEAFDDAVDDLRARGLKVEILPDYPGVVR